MKEITKKPKISIYKPNSKRTGGAMTIEIESANENQEGCIILTLANQCGSPDKREFPHFDWECAIRVRLPLFETAEILRLLTGETESLRDGHGIYLIEGNARVTLRMRHVIDPTTGYVIEADYTGCDAVNHASMMINNTEAIGILYAIKASMGKLAFGE